MKALLALLFSASAAFANPCAQAPAADWKQDTQLFVEQARFLSAQEVNHHGVDQAVYHPATGTLALYSAPGDHVSLRQMTQARDRFLSCHVWVSFVLHINSRDRLVHQEYYGTGINGRQRLVTLLWHAKYSEGANVIKGGNWVYPSE